MAIDLDVVTRLNKATAREAAREAQQYFKDAGKDAGDDFGDGLAKGITGKTPEIEKALKKVQDASGKVIVEQEKLNALKRDSSTADEKLIAQSEKLAKAHREEEAAVNAVNRALDDHKNKTNEVDVAAQKATRSIGDLGGSFNGLGLGLVGVVGMLPAAATGLAEVAGAIQQLSGAALAAPGIFAGIAASVGTATLGMSGMKDAFTASIKALDGTKSSVEAANKALADLSPNAAEAVKSVVGLKGTFTDLRDISATNIFQGFSTNLKTLVAADLPVVTKGIDGISKALGSNLAEVMRSLGSSSSQGFLDRILGNTGTAQAKLTAAINPIVNAVGVLTAAGSDTLPRLAEAIGNIADRFNRFITTADANGNLSKWINDGITGMGQLGETVLNIGKTFTAITQAAGTGGLLGTLESATDKLQTFLNSTQGQADLRKYFAEGRDMLSQLKDIAVSAGPVLAGMFQGAVSATKTWLPVIKQVLDIINSIPGGAQAVVAAFVAWESIKGVAALATSLGNIANLLKIVLPEAAATGAAGITASFTTAAGLISKAFGAIALPATLLEAMHFQQTHAAADDAANGRTKTLPIGPHGMGVAVTPNANKNGYAGGGGSFDSVAGQPAPGYSGFLDPNWSPVRAAPVNKPGTFRRRDGSIGTLPGADTPGVPTPDVSGYTAPTVTSGGGGGGGAGDKTPYIDPSKWQVGNPLAGMPGASPQANQQDVFEADSRALTAAHNLEQGKLALAVLEAKGTATQAEILTARNNLQEQERALYDAQFKDLEARQGKMAKASSELQGIFAPLDQDFGVSGGIPGIVKNLTAFLGNLALGGAIASSPTLQAAALQMQAASGTGGGGGYGAGGFSSGAYGLGIPTAGARAPGSYGLPGGANSGGYGGGGTQFPDWVQQMAADFGIKPSTYPGHQESDRHEAGYAPNPDHENRGIDWTGPVENLQRFSDYLKTIPQDLEQVIWQNPNTGQKTGIGGGQINPGYYPQSTYDEHGGAGGVNTHVHTRQSAPIPLPGSPADDFTAPADASSMGPAPLGGGLGPSTAYPGAAPAQRWGNPTLPANLSGGGEGPVFSKPASGPMAGGAASQPGIGAGGNGAPGTQSMSQTASPGGPGGGITPGGTLDSVLSGAAAAADMFAPGAGQAAQVGIKLASRAIQEGAQASAIGVSGLMETFLPHNSELGDPGKSWFGKIAGGIAGARPATPNAAQKSAPPQQANDQGQKDGGPAGPMVNIENMHTGGADGQAVGNDIARQQAASYSAGQPR